MSTAMHHSRSLLPLWIVVFCLPVHFCAMPSLAEPQEDSPGVSDAEFVRPFVSETTCLIVKINAAALELPDLPDWFEALDPQPRTLLSQLQQQVEGGTQRFRAIVGNQTVYAALGIPISEERIPVLAFMKMPEEKLRTSIENSLREELKSDVAVHGDCLVAAPVNGTEVEAMLTSCPATPREGIDDAFAAVAQYPVQVLLLPPAHVRRTFAELLPELPIALGGGSTSILTDGVQWAALGLEPSAARGELIIQSASNKAAQELARYLPIMLKSFRQHLPASSEPIVGSLVASTLAELKPQVREDRVVVCIDGAKTNLVGSRLLGSAIQMAEQQSRRGINQRRLKQIVIAMHNHHDVYRVLPPQDRYRGADEKHQLSWRVHLLPFLEENALYEQFHLDESWDSPHNRELISRIPDVFKSVSYGVTGGQPVPNGYTTFLAPRGDGTVFGEAKASRLRDIRDGVSNTIVVVEVAAEKAVPWTAPEDYGFNPKEAAAGLAIDGDGRWLAAFADGRVIALPKDLPNATVLHLFQMTDGQPIDQDSLR